MKDLSNVTKLISDLSEDQILDFLVGILSPAELEQVITRLKIVKLLKKKVPQHEIAGKLGIGVATVSRGAKMLKEGRFEYV
jgi:TrpR family trp operon transcriptional repressor